MISEEEEWQLRLENAKLRARVQELEAGIRKWGQANGHDLCWENNMELWALISPGTPYPHKTVPPWPEFLQNCVLYRKQLDAPQPIAQAPAPTPLKLPPMNPNPLDKWFDRKWTELTEYHKKNPKR